MWPSWLSSTDENMIIMPEQFFPISSTTTIMAENSTGNRENPLAHKKNKISYAHMWPSNRSKCDSFVTPVTQFSVDLLGCETEHQNQKSRCVCETQKMFSSYTDTSRTKVSLQVDWILHADTVLHVVLETAPVQKCLAADVTLERYWG